jgi:hypothetical protein
MSDMGVYTTTVKAISKIESNSSGSESERPSRANQRGPLLESPLLRRSFRHDSSEAVGVYKEQPLSQTLVDLSPGLLVLAFFALTVLWLVDYDRVRSTDGTMAQAQAAAAENHIDRAIGLLDRLSIVRSGNLKVDERNLLNNSLLKRSAVFESNGNQALAMADLLRITPDCASYSEARRKLKEYGKHAATESPAKAEDATAAERKTMPDLVRAAAQNAVPRQIASREQSLSTTKHSQQSEEAGQSASSIEPSAESAAALVTNANHPVESTKAGQSARVKYSDADVAQYNKLLAEYFIASQTTSDPARQQSGSAESKSPPSLKEWLEQGRPAF